MSTQSSQIGAYVPTTFIFDVARLQEINVNSPEFKELLVRLYQNINLMCNVLNVKDTGIYNNDFETINGQSWFPNPANNSSTVASAQERPVYRRVYLIANLAGSATVAHNITITSITTFTRIYGVANDTSGNNYYPLPWASAAGATNIELKVNGTNIVITNNSGITFATCYVILEWLTS